MNKLKNMPNEPVYIQSLSHDGRGITSIGNKTTFVSFALPGETVKYQLVKKHSKYLEATAVEIHNPSTDRTNPPCAHFGICGGCSLQHLNMEKQIELKQQILIDQLKHFGKVEAKSISPPIHGLSLAYRRKARLGVKYVIKKNKVLVGFREKSGRYLADIQSCSILHPSIGNRITELSELISTLERFAYIPQIEVAIGDQDTALIFRHLEKLSEADQLKLQNFGEKNQLHIYLQPNPPDPLKKIWPMDEKNRLIYTLLDQNLEFLFHPLDFTQINLEVNRQMVNQALTFLDLHQDESVLDLFCGIGNFTLPIARHAKQVVGIEGSPEMVKRGYENAQHNHIENVSFHSMNLDEPNSSATWFNQYYDKILIDPPRVGAKAILPFLHKLNPKRIVYISCNPATLARDAHDLVHQFQYQLTDLVMMNMFPHTSHIEAMAVFENRN
jgi:23S rRNA (uracil1939-C5)-methyltransferase